MELMENLRVVTMDSREVAQMIGKKHNNLVRDIENYIQYLENSKLSCGLESMVTDYFIESSYQAEGAGRLYKKYDCTRKGCEFIANKMTGEKGTVFTIRYIDRFHEMENQTSGMTPIDLIIATAQELKALELKQQEQDRKLTAVVDEQKRIKGKVDILNDKEFTVMGYANIHSIHLNNKLANRLGRKAAKLSRDEGYPIGNATHPVFGRVNTYHTDILDVVFDEWEQ